MRLHGRRGFKVPLKMKSINKSPYMLYDLVYSNGKMAPKVTRDFENIARFYNTDKEYLLKRKHVNRMNQGGIRFAILGNKHSS
mmetsp:Transcript_6785/g.11411  ORF Transcript_6785/g.11411 Transcript_6785/m.11411 type:complete len:83 (+) Transcript_6785:1242-1490(+)